MVFTMFFWSASARRTDIYWKSVKTGLADFLWRSEVGEKPFFDQKRFRSNFFYFSTKVGFYDVLSKKMWFLVDFAQKHCFPPSHKCFMGLGKFFNFLTFSICSPLWGVMVMKVRYWYGVYHVFLVSECT